MTGLDPSDWAAARAQAHAMLDGILDHVEHIRERPVWQPMPAEVRRHFTAALPRRGEGLESVCAEFQAYVEPYGTGNLHPGFMGWVHGAGNIAGVVGDMLAAGLNANCGGRDHAPIAVERQITDWMRKLFGFPDTATGLFLTGSSMANLVALWVARTATLGSGVKSSGLGGTGGAALRAYTSAAAHCCVAQAMDLAGFGTQGLRIIPVDSHHRMDMDALRQAIAEDRASGFTPFFVVGTAGTVDTGAIDPLDRIADLCREEALWFHVDGAYGALAALSRSKAPRLAGLERADSIAFDFHKWGQVPYDAGFVLVRDGEQHLGTFSTPATYLSRATRGLAAGEFWPCDYGPDLSRGFRALKTWFTLKTYGLEGLERVVDETCRLALHLGQSIERSPYLELMAPISLNIVCFRYVCADPDAINGEIVMRLHESGLAAPSLTTIGGKRVIRAAIMNHRTTEADIDRMVAAVIETGAAASRPPTRRSAPCPDRRYG